jgi:hypothetical protein
MEAAWLFVPAALVPVVFVVASLRALSPNAGPTTERVAEVGYYACLFVGSVILLGLTMYR